MTGHGSRRRKSDGERGNRRRATLAGLLLVVGLAAGVPLAAGPTTQPTKGAVITIKGEIDDILRDSVERRLAEARSVGATTIIFELNTPGGMATSALDICRTIKDLPPEIRTVAWVYPEAYSAGAMISVACNEIWMGGSARIGDCAPIMITPTGGLESLGKTERAKAESPILLEFRDSATRNGYDQLLSRAMVTMGEEVWWLENARDPAVRRFVTASDKQKLIDDVEADQREWKVIEHYTDPLGGQSVPVAQPVNRADALLTMSQSDAVAFGFARGIVRDVHDLTTKLNLASTPMRLTTSGWEAFAAWLNSPLVRGVLFMIVLIGAYVEFQHPGMILPGVTAAVALVIFLAAPYAAGLANIWTFVLLGIGLILLALELFVIPGFGISGILGVALILVAIIGTFVPQEPTPNPSRWPIFAWPTLPGTWKALEHGILVLSGSVGVALVGIVLILRYLPQLKVSAGVVAPNPDAAALVIPDPNEQAILIGDVGIVTGDLRPGGLARFGHEIVDVQSQGEYVEAGRRVQVIKHEGLRIVVRVLPDEARGQT